MWTKISDFFSSFGQMVKKILAILWANKKVSSFFVAQIVALLTGWGFAIDTETVSIIMGTILAVFIGNEVRVKVSKPKEE